MKNYYYILGIDNQANESEIKKAYRKLAQKFHPDKNEEDPFFEARFKDIQEAFEVLSDPINRENYNQKLATFLQTREPNSSTESRKEEDVNLTKSEKFYKESWQKKNIVKTQKDLPAIDASKIYFFGVVAIVVLVLVYTFVFTGKKDSYADELIKFRVEKDDFFKNSPDSPIEDREAFRQLQYYPPDPSYRIIADIQPISDTTRLKVGRTDGTNEYMTRYAIATFQLGGKQHKLLLLKSTTDEEELFLPFNDKTNGFDTYGGGRYLDDHNKGLEWNVKDSKLIIDFNFAYNPFCTYNANYSCPIPPTQNFMDIVIRAGEKDFEK